MTFGIRLDRAETGYGWLELAEPPAAVPVAEFVEKPDAATAAAMLETGRHAWNAGIFLFRAQTIRAAVETHAPELVTPVRAAVALRSMI